VEAFKVWQCRWVVRMRREIEGVFEHAFRRSQKNPIAEGAPAGHDHGEAEFHQWVDGYALAAWIRAAEDLLTLDRPSAFVSTQESPARHWPG
jgi:hypothetical protein